MQGTIVGTSDHTVTHSLYVLDPDGNEIELYIDVPGIDWGQQHRAGMSPTGRYACRGEAL